MSSSAWTIASWSPNVRLIASVKLKKEKQDVSYFLKFDDDDQVEIDAKDAKILIAANSVSRAPSTDDSEDDDHDDGIGVE